MRIQTPRTTPAQPLPVRGKFTDQLENEDDLADGLGFTLETYADT